MAYTVKARHLCSLSSLDVSGRVKVQLLRFHSELEKLDTLAHNLECLSIAEASTMLVSVQLLEQIPV